MKNIILIGCGGHARSVIDLIESTGEWNIHGLIGLRDQAKGTVMGYPVIGSDADLSSLRETCSEAVLAIGQLPEPTKRKRLAARLKAIGFMCPTLISHHAIVSVHSQLGPGTTVGHGAIVNTCAVVGAHCIINSGALIEHDAKIGDHCHISTGALVNGGVRIGSGSFIGSGAIIREGLELPDQTVIGAGKCVMGWPLKI